MTRIKESASTVIYVNGNYIENQTIHVHQGGMLRKKRIIIWILLKYFVSLHWQIYRYTDIHCYSEKTLLRTYPRLCTREIFLKNICMYLYVYFLLNTMTLLKKNIFYYQINTKFFYSISERILVYSVNKQKVKEQKTQHVETANTTRCLCKVNTLKSRTQHVVFAAGMNIFMSNLKSSTNWPAD